MQARLTWRQKQIHRHRPLSAMHSSSCPLSSNDDALHVTIATSRDTKARCRLVLKHGECRMPRLWRPLTQKILCLLHCCSGFRTGSGNHAWAKTLCQACLRIQWLLEGLQRFEQVLCVFIFCQQLFCRKLFQSRCTSPLKQGNIICRLWAT